MLAPSCPSEVRVGFNSIFHIPVEHTSELVCSGSPRQCFASLYHLILVRVHNISVEILPIANNNIIMLYGMNKTLS